MVLYLISERRRRKMEKQKQINKCFLRKTKFSRIHGSMVILNYMDLLFSPLSFQAIQNSSASRSRFTRSSNKNKETKITEQSEKKFTQEFGSEKIQSTCFLPDNMLFIDKLRNEKHWIDSIYQLIEPFISCYMKDVNYR